MAMHQVGVVNYIVPGHRLAETAYSPLAQLISMDPVLSILAQITPNLGTALPTITTRDKWELNENTESQELKLQ